MEPLAPKIWSQKARADAGIGSPFSKDCALSQCCLFFSNMTFSWCVWCWWSLVHAESARWRACACTKGLCAYWAELMLIDFDRVWRTVGCVCLCGCVCVLTSVLGVMCVCWVSGCEMLFQCWMVVLGNSHISRRSLSKGGQEMELSPSQQLTWGHRVSNSFLFLACPIYRRNEAIKMCVWLAVSYSTVCALHWTCSLSSQCLHLCVCVSLYRRDTVGC